VGHANYSRSPISRWFEELGSWIQCLHLSDNRGEFDDHLPLGRGTIDWSLVNRLWEGLGRDIPVTLETGDIASTKESARFLCRNGYFGLKGNGYEKF
jgi:sugar phosphate isomerase/epimerase